MKKTLSCITWILLLTSTLALAFNIQIIKADESSNFVLVYATDWNEIDFDYWNYEGESPRCVDSHIIFHLPKGERNYKSAMSTDQPIYYGKFVTEFKMTPVPKGLLGSFYLYHGPDGTETHEEIDFEWYRDETGYYNEVVIRHDGEEVQRKYVTPKIDDEDYHTFELVYLKNYVNMNIDGDSVYKVEEFVDPPLFFFTGGAGNPLWLPPPKDDYYLYIDRTEIYIYADRVVPDDYPTIQEAINAASEGDIVYVRAGTYYEHVVVDKSLSLVGEDRSTTVIDGEGTGNVVTIAANDVTITGFKIQNSGRSYPWLESGIYIAYSSDNSISYNSITNNNHGIRGYSSSDNTLYENNIVANDYHGVCLEESSNYNTICGNKIMENEDVGVRLSRHCNYNNISRNTMTDNGEEGVELDIYSNYNTVLGNTITNNHFAGIQIWRSSFNNIFRNIITNNSYYIFRYGVWFDHGSNYNNVFENLIANHMVGVEFSYGGSYNWIYHNNFVNNTYQALPDPGDYNFWNNSYPSGGNYWSDQYHGDCADHYRGPNQDTPGSDGIVDIPYVLNANNKDNYPLMAPWTPIKDIEYVNETIQDLPDEIFSKPPEDVPDVKNDFSDLLNDTLENIEEGNYDGAIEKLNRIKEKIFEEIVESGERQEIISIIDNLIAYLENRL